MSLPGVEFFIFGNPFLQEYYSVWDMDNDRIGFSPSIYSRVPTLVPGKLTTIRPLIDPDTTPSQYTMNFLAFISNIAGLIPHLADPLITAVSDSLFLQFVIFIGIPLCCLGLCCKLLPIIINPPPLSYSGKKQKLLMNNQQEIMMIEISLIK